MLKTILVNFLGKKPALDIVPAGADLHKGQPDVIEVGQRFEPAFANSIRIRQVDAGSCNACEWECIALINPIYDIQRFGMDVVASPRHADVLLVTGPVSRQMQLALTKTYLATPEPRFVVACGDCAIDGGVYRRSYAVTNGVASVVPVDFYIPGCPPTPEQIIQGFMEFMQKISVNSSKR